MVKIDYCTLCLGSLIAVIVVSMFVKWIILLF